MMSGAFESGGNRVGLLTTFGFALALAIAAIAAVRRFAFTWVNDAVRAIRSGVQA